MTTGKAKLINKDKIGVWGGSAGAQILNMWLGFSDEMANVNSKNPIEKKYKKHHESTSQDHRIILTFNGNLCDIATKGGQTTMESDFWRKHIAKYALKPEI